MFNSLYKGFQFWTEFSLKICMLGLFTEIYGNYLAENTMHLYNQHKRKINILEKIQYITYQLLKMSSVQEA